MTNLDSILKSRDITLPTKKGPSSQGYGFSRSQVWMWELDCEESWVLKNWWCWRRLLRVPWTASRSNQSILKEISPGCSLEGLMLKLKLQYFGHLMGSADSFEKTLMLGKIEGRRRRGRQRMRRLDGITDSMDMSLVNSGSWWWTGRPGVLQSMGSQRVGCNWGTELNWTFPQWETLYTLEILLWQQWYVICSNCVFILGNISSILSVERVIILPSNARQKYQALSRMWLHRNSPVRVIGVSIRKASLEND